MAVLDRLVTLTNCGINKNINLRKSISDSDSLNIRLWEFSQIRQREIELASESKVETH